MKKIDLATIRANDEASGELITISIVPAEYDGEIGYRLEASNGDDIGHYKPQSIEKCRQDALSQWGGWQSFALIEA